MKTPVLRVVFAALLLPFAALSARADEGWTVGAKLPALSAYGLEGKIPSLAGKVVYLDFWASWCAPCHASFPVLARWQEQLGPKGFVVLAVNVDDKPELMEKFLGKLPLPGGAVVRDANHKLVAAANGPTMPTSFLIDRKGVIRKIHAGFRKGDAEELQKTIEALLAEK